MRREIDPIVKAVSKLYNGGSIRVADENELSFRGSVADRIFSKPTFWANANEALVLVDDPDEFMEMCQQRGYPVRDVEIKSYCHSDREGWKKMLDIGRGFDAVMNGRRFGLDRQLGLMVIGDLHKIREADFDVQINLEWLAKEAKGNWNGGGRGDLSILAFDDTVENETMNRLRKAFSGNMVVRQKLV